MREFKEATLPALNELKINYVKWTGNNFNEVRDFVEHFKTSFLHKSIGFITNYYV